MIIRDPGFTVDPPIDSQLSDNAMAEADRVADDEPQDAAASDRQPKGDHNRRLALNLDVDVFALEAGITTNQLREYEQTSPGHEFDLEVAARVGPALERLEANPPPTQKVSNGPAV